MDGQWRVIHEHISVPIDMQTEMAVLQLEGRSKR
jgi:ketosteroid isomerase-like protein